MSLLLLMRPELIEAMLADVERQLKLDAAQEALVKQLKKEITIEVATLAATTAGGTQWPN